MSAPAKHRNPVWFVLNHIGIAFQDLARKEVDRFNAAQNVALELFAPTYVVKEERNGQIRLKTVNLTFHYVFVRGTLDQVKALCAQNNGFSFVIDHSSEDRHYATVSARDMANFKNIARAYKNCLPYFSLGDIDLEEGDLVEVIGGDFPGLTGTYMPRPKSNSGNIVLNVYNNVGTIAFNVRATDVRVLEFSHKNTRANDQIDAVVPHLFKALRYYHNDEPLPSALAAKLTVFCSRLGMARLNNRKLDARLQAILHAANHILGNMEAATAHKDKYERLRDVITHPWTVAMTRLLIAVTSDDDSLILSAAHIPADATPQSQNQRAIADECAYYASVCSR